MELAVCHKIGLRLVHESYLKAGELNLGLCYDSGNGVEVDKKKAKHY